MATAIIFLALATGGWWLSGFDSKLIGDNRSGDIARRILRCGFTIFLLVILLLLPGAMASLPIVFFIGGALAIIWVGCLAEFVSTGFHRLIGFAGSDREFATDEDAQNLDMVASLLKSGRHEEAAQLCETLKQSGDANILVLETLLARHGISFDTGRMAKPLTMAHQARLAGNFVESETILRSLLEKNAADADAALLLMQIYVRDFRRSDKAMEILRTLEKQPHVPAAQIEYAQRSIQEWGRKKTAPKPESLPTSVEELLACGYLGTAIEILQRKVKEQPGDFDLCLKLAEAHGLHSGNLPRAEKIVEAMEEKFSAEQIKIAKAKLDEWRNTKPQLK